MKSVTEFAGYTLTAGLAAQKAFAAEGKSPEEIIKHYYPLAEIKDLW